MFHFYSSPVALGQINFVLVLISTNHNARYLYSKMDISRTAYGSFMHSVSVSFAAGIWQSHPLQHHTPDLNYYMKEHENFEEKHRQKEGSWSKIVPPFQDGM